MFLPVSVETIKRGIGNPKRTINLVSELEHVTTACVQLQDTLSTLISYVSDVLVCRDLLAVFLKV